MNRATLGKVIAATTGAGMPVYVTVNNKAEGSAPLSVVEFAKAVEQAAVDLPIVD